MPPELASELASELAKYSFGVKKDCTLLMEIDLAMSASNLIVEWQLLGPRVQII